VRILSVSGATSRAGKTALAVSLLRALPAGSAVAVKFTTAEDVFKRCPRGTPCVVCDIDVPYRIVDDAAVLREPGTDTDRLAEAGASRVLWAIAKQAAAGEAWEAVGRRLTAADRIVLEGSSIVERVLPELLCFVVHPFLSPARWKPTSGPLIERADLVVVNVPQGETRPPAAEVMAGIGRFRDPGDARVADVTRPLADWAPEVTERLGPVGNGHGHENGRRLVGHAR
jgi:molybdopterin-guanine dinucleotide biosynthesis protein